MESSFDLLVTWLDVHPCRDDPVAPLFVTLGSGCGGARRGEHVSGSKEAAAPQVWHIRW